MAPQGLWVGIIYIYIYLRHIKVKTIYSTSIIYVSIYLSIYTYIYIYIYTNQTLVDERQRFARNLCLGSGASA